MSDYMEYSEYYKKAWEEQLKKATGGAQEEIKSLRSKLAVAEDALTKIDDECARHDTNAWTIATQALAKIRGEG